MLKPQKTSSWFSTIKHRYRIGESQALLTSLSLKKNVIGVQAKKRELLVEHVEQWSRLTTISHRMETKGEDLNRRKGFQWTRWIYEQNK